MKTFCFYLSIACFMLSACTEQQKKFDNETMNQLEWILGYWQGELDGNPILEHWEKKDDHTFTGKGFLVNGGDTILFEKLRIEFTKGQIFYVADVASNHKEIPFQLIQILPNNALFQNNTNDFPQRINYIFNEEDHLYASLEGEIKGEWVKKEIYFKKLGNRKGWF